MPNLEAVTQYVNKDEKAYFLVEINSAPKAVLNTFGHGRRRYQIMWVNRNGVLAAYVVDLGEANAYAAKQLRIPSFWEHTVAELQDMAEKYRLYGYLADENYLANLQGESTFMQDAFRYAEEGRKILHNQSVFGPGVSKERVLAHREKRKEKRVY